MVYSITGHVYTMGQSLKVYIGGLQYNRTGLHYGTKFKGVYLLVYSITGQVCTIGQSLKVYICGLKYYMTDLHYGTKLKGVYLWIKVLHDRFTLWDKV